MSLYPIPLPARASAFVEAVTLGNSPVVAIPLPLVHLLGDWVAAAFLSQCMFHASHARGSFARTHADWERELNLSADQVRRCVRTCAGIIEVERRGIPARNYYQVNYAELASRLAALQPATGAIHELGRGVSAASDGETQPLAIQETPQHSSLKREQEKTRWRDDVRQPSSAYQQHLTRLLTAWNEHRHTLPEATGWTTPRRRALTDLLRDSGGDVDTAASLLADATKEVAQDEFWKQKRYGLDTLLPKVQGRAEAWRSRHSSKDNGQGGSWSVGERVTYRREGYHVEAVTATHLDLFDEVNGSVRVNFASDDIRAVRAVSA